MGRSRVALRHAFLLDSLTNVGETPTLLEVLFPIMRLLALTVRNYRVHRELSLAFDPARNLIGGPNESGKSTLIEAAHRALFLRAKTGGSIQREMVSSRHLGDPEVTLAFEAAGTCWELEKRFAGPKGSTRLTPAGGTTLKDDEAETRLADLLKTELSGRTNATQLAATWAHLWVWQGSSGSDPSVHATQHQDTLVQRLQQDGIAAVMQSATDQRVRAKIAATYETLFTPTGRPRAGSAPEVARAEMEAAEDAVRSARETAARLEQAVEDHTRAEKELTETESVLPGLREQQAAVETKLAQVRELQTEEETRRRAWETAGGTVVHLGETDFRLRAHHHQAASIRTGLVPSIEYETTFAAEEESARLASQAADISQRDTSAAARHARQYHDLVTAAVSAFEKGEKHQWLVTRTREADAIRAELGAHREALARLPELSAKNLQQLRKLERDASQAAATFAAMATGIEVLHTDQPVTLDGHPLPPGETRVLTDIGELAIGAGTLVRIHPGGGTSLAEARAREETTRRALATALERLTLRDLDHAVTVAEQRQALEQQIAHCETRWKAIGGETAATELAAATTAFEAATAEVQRRQEALDAEGGRPSRLSGSAAVSAAMPLDCAGPEPAQQPSEQARRPFSNTAETAVLHSRARRLLPAAQAALTAAEQAETTARRSAEQLRTRLEKATRTLQTHRDNLSASRLSLRDLETRIQVLEDTHGDTAARAQSLVAARDAEQHAATELAATRQSLAALAPADLTADLDRFQRAIVQQETRRRDGENRRLIARDRLTLDGSTDPQAELSHALARSAAARDTHTTAQRRAQAIAELQRLFADSREALDRGLVQPLADRISGYLQCLFGPGARLAVKLGEAGIESLELARADDSAFGFATLSGGAKEQVAAAVRLAMAEILATDHDRCLPVVFDDAFAYTDPDRVQALQRMLNLAAIRGLQVIVLTCTPTDYSAFGASELRLS
jgi:DNA repair exonuclease SbcCD ATPase subunit